MGSAEYGDASRPRPRFPLPRFWVTIAARPVSGAETGVAMQIRGVDLAVREAGAGLPFLWGHGLLGSMAQEDAAALLEWRSLAKAARLVRYDARGHGGSEASLDSEDYRWPALAQDLLALADAIGADRAVFGGLSMGCATALHAAVLDPGRVEGLVLAAPPTAWRTRPRQARVYRLLALAVEHWGLGPFRIALALSRLRPAPPHLAALQRSMSLALRRADRRAAAAALRGAASSDLPDPERLAGIQAPALVLAWRSDPTHPVSTAERLAELLPRAELQVARSLEDLRTWSASVERFLRAVKPLPPASAPPRS